MANSTELIVSEGIEATKEITKSGIALKTIAKYGAKAGLGLAAAYGVYCGVKKVVELIRKPKKAKNSEPGKNEEDPMDYVPELDPVDGE